MVDRDLLGVDELVARARGSGRYLALENEDAIVAQVAGRVLEAAHRVVLREESAERVVYET